jgi:chromate reductase
MYQIAVFIGSLRKESINKKLMHALNKLHHPNLKFNIIDISMIPHFNQDDENNMPEIVAHFKNEVAKSDGVLFVTPEYNRSIPGVLKNVIDWGTRPYGKNIWINKPTAMIGASIGAIGTAAAQSHLRSIIVALGAVVMGLPEVYTVFKNEMVDQNGQFTNEDTKKFMQSFLDRFSDWVSHHK